jgi:hypothetical protein
MEGGGRRGRGTGEEDRGPRTGDRDYAGLRSSVFGLSGFAPVSGHLTVIMDSLYTSCKL